MSYSKTYNSELEEHFRAVLINKNYTGNMNPERLKTIKRLVSAMPSIIEQFGEHFCDNKWMFVSAKKKLLMLVGIGTAYALADDEPCTIMVNNKEWLSLIKIYNRFKNGRRYLL